MRLFQSNEPRRLSFESKFGKYYGHLIDRDFLLGHDPHGDSWFYEKKEPAVNIKEEDEFFEFEIPLPGWKKEEISVELNNHVLTIFGEKSEDWKEDSRYIKRERYMDKFERSFQLSPLADPDKVEAELKNGILTIRFFHTKEKETGKKIVVA